MNKLMIVISLMLLSACGSTLNDSQIKVDCIDTSNYSMCEVTCLNNDTCKGD